MTTAEAGRLAVQVGEGRWVVAWRVKPMAVVGHIKMKFEPVAVIVSGGWLTGNETLNTVPYVRVPAPAPDVDVVP